MISDDDRDLLAREMRGVKPLKYKRVDLKSAQTKMPEFTLCRRRRQAAVETRPVVDRLSDSHLVTIAPEEYIEHIHPGLQHRRLQRLRLGQMDIQYNLDLHGLTFKEARVTLPSFISFCRKNSYTTVRVVHGKSRNSRPHQATMKSYVNAWLRQIPGVLGFASCLPVDGGMGAVYVLLGRLR